MLNKQSDFQEEEIINQIKIKISYQKSDKLEVEITGPFSSLKTRTIIFWVNFIVVL
jgi:hypothetical protein